MADLGPPADVTAATEKPGDRLVDQHEPGETLRGPQQLDARRLV